MGGVEGRGGEAKQTGAVGGLGERGNEVLGKAMWHSVAHRIKYCIKQEGVQCYGYVALIGPSWFTYSH